MSGVELSVKWAMILPIAKFLKWAKKVEEIITNPEVKNTLKRIKKNEPKYKWKDGEPYENDWRGWGQLLPTKDRGYYQEWTVDTPWIKWRWEQRIINEIIENYSLQIIIMVPLLLYSLKIIFYDK